MTKSEEELFDRISSMLSKYHETEPHAYLEAADIMRLVEAHTATVAAEAARLARIDEHNLVFSKTGELDEAYFAEWSLERLKELGVDDAID